MHGRSPRFPILPGLGAGCARSRNEQSDSLNWQEKSGYETASYVGYSPIKTCECKESAEGIPLGKVTYDEENYYLG